MMSEGRHEKGCDVDWTEVGQNSNWNWDTATNARTEQRIKKMRDQIEKN